MTLKTLIKCDFNVKTKSHLPISKKGMTKIPLPKKRQKLGNFRGSKLVLVCLISNSSKHCDKVWPYCH